MVVGNVANKMRWLQMSHVTTGALSNPTGGEGSSRQTGIGLSLSKLHRHPWSIEFTKRKTSSRVLHPRVVTGDLSHGHTAPPPSTETTRKGLRQALLLGCYCNTCSSRSGSVPGALHCVLYFPLHRRAVFRPKRHRSYCARPASSVSSCERLGDASASSARNAAAPRPAETHRAPEPSRSRHSPNSHGDAACAMRAGTMSNPCRCP